MNLDDLNNIINQISFDQWIPEFEHLTFVTGQDESANMDGISFWLQVRSTSLPANLAGGRKWRISRFMSKSEVVQTALKAVLAWWEHETREAFLYKGKPIFGPHYDVDLLVGIVGEEALDVRVPA